MASKTGIEYVDATWNPWSGCTPVSPGCANCYAKRMATRFGRDFSTVTQAPDKRFYEPLHWSAGKRILTCSMGDFFHEDADKWRGDAWAVTMDAPQHTYMLLTKRPENITARLPLEWNGSFDKPSFSRTAPPNVWLGVTVESKVEKWRINNMLRKIPAAKRWVSFEPLLTDVGKLNLTGISFIVVGGESGPGARPMKAEWARSIRDQCKAAGVPFFMKQMAKREPIPEDLQIKEYPE
jgi:protein gp37